MSCARSDDSGCRRSRFAASQSRALGAVRVEVVGAHDADLRRRGRWRAQTPFAVPRRFAVQHGVGPDPPHEQVQVVLPRVADTAVDLQAVLRELVGHVADVGGDHADDLGGIVGVAPDRARHGSRTGLARLEDHRVVGHDVLERLERADRPPERDAVLRVLDRHREQCVHRADRLGDDERDCDLQLPFEGAASRRRHRAARRRSTAT